MPYIPEEERGALLLTSPGRLNYAITKTALEFIELHTPGERVAYDTLNAAIGALECAKLELYRRLGSRLENAAIERNGDLPEYERLFNR